MRTKSDLPGLQSEKCMLDLLKVDLLPRCLTKLINYTVHVAVEAVEALQHLHLLSHRPKVGQTHLRQTEEALSVQYLLRLHHQSLIVVAKDHLTVHRFSLRDVWFPGSFLWGGGRVMMQAGVSTNRKRGIVLVCLPYGHQVRLSQYDNCSELYALIL